MGKQASVRAVIIDGNNSVKRSFVRLTEGKTLMEGIEKNNLFKVSETRFGKIVSDIFGWAEGKSKVEDINSDRHLSTRYEYKNGKDLRKNGREFENGGWEVLVRNKDSGKVYHLAVKLKDGKEYWAGLDNAIVDEVKFWKSHELVFKYTRHKENPNNSYEIKTSGDRSRFLDEKEWRLVSKPKLILSDMSEKSARFAGIENAEIENFLLKFHYPEHLSRTIHEHMKIIYIPVRHIWQNKKIDFRQNDGIIQKPDVFSPQMMVLQLSLLKKIRVKGRETALQSMANAQNNMKIQMGNADVKKHIAEDNSEALNAFEPKQNIFEAGHMMTEEVKMQGPNLNAVNIYNEKSGKAADKYFADEFAKAGNGTGAVQIENPFAFGAMERSFGSSEKNEGKTEDKRDGGGDAPEGKGGEKPKFTQPAKFTEKREAENKIARSEALKASETSGNEERAKNNMKMQRHEMVKNFSFGFARNENLNAEKIGTGSENIEKQMMPERKIKGRIEKREEKADEREKGNNEQKHARKERELEKEKEKNPEQAHNAVQKERKRDKEKVPEKIKAIIFDLDGVLSDSENAHLKTFNAVFARFGVRVSKKFWLANYTGRGAEFIVNDLISKNKLKGVDAKQIMEERMRLFGKLAKEKKIKPVSGAPEIVKNAQRKKLKTIVASGGHRENIKDQLDSIRLSKMKYLGMEDVKERKPNPQIFLKASKEVGVKPSQCLVIEDSKAGLIAAKNAKMRCVLIGAHHPKKLRKMATIWAASLKTGKVANYLKKAA